MASPGYPASTVSEKNTQAKKCRFFIKDVALAIVVVFLKLFLFHQQRQLISSK
jgi:hypothetical protein